MTKNIYESEEYIGFLNVLIDQNKRNLEVARQREKISLGSDWFDYRQEAFHLQQEIVKYTRLINEIKQRIRGGEND